MEKEIKVASLFAGIGGVDLGFKKAGAKPIWANEIDKYCAITFNANHKDTKLVVDDICNINGHDIPNIDILTAGFPCQPFSIAGYRKGFEDDRGNMFFQIMRLVDEMDKANNKPRVLFLENVKNLKTHDNGKTFKVIKKELENRGYFVVENILNTCEYGNLPQNRERIFIIGFLNKNDYDNFKWPNKIKLTRTIKSVVDWNAEIEEKYIYDKDKKCYPILIENIRSKDSIYQYRRVYVRENKTGICPTLTANMGMGGHNVPLILDNKERIRKLLPIECLMLQGFPENFIIPIELSDSRIYKQAGNAVSVNIIKNIAVQIIKAMGGHTMKIQEFVEANIEEINNKISNFKWKPSDTDSDDGTPKYYDFDIKRYLSNKLYTELLSDSEKQTKIMNEFAEMMYVKAKIKEIANKYIYYHKDLENFIKHYFFDELNYALFREQNNIFDHIENTIFSSLEIDDKRFKFISNDFKKLLSKSLFIASKGGFSSNILNIESGVMTANAGDSAQFLFISRAILAGYNTSNVDVRSSRYDAIIDYKGKLLKVQVKGISSDTISFKDRDRGGQGIDHTHERNKGRRITSSDCDIYVAVDKQVGLCYIIPMSYIDNWDDASIIAVKTSDLDDYKENWKIIDEVANNRI